MGIFLQADCLYFLQGIGWEKHIKLSGGPRSLVWATKRSQAVWAKGLECPNWPRMAKNIQIAQNAQNGPKCPEWPKRPRMAQNSPEQPKGRKWHTCPKGPEFAQKAQNFQHSGLFWAWPRMPKIFKTHFFLGHPVEIQDINNERIIRQKYSIKWETIAYQVSSHGKLSFRHEFTSWWLNAFYHLALFMLPAPVLRLNLQFKPLVSNHQLMVQVWL